MNRQGQRAALGVALHTGIVPPNIIEAFWVYDVLLRRVRDVFAARAVALLTADVPLRKLTGGEVVVHGMTAVAGRASGPVGVLRPVVSCPPVCVVRDVIGQPASVLNIPLSR
jgi:hypothetical protein